MVGSRKWAESTAPPGTKAVKRSQRGRMEEGEVKARLGKA
jgi:hypothetical protein